MKRGGRTRGRGRGRGRGHPRRKIEPLMKVKPFVSSEMQNISMELELLKQKREMIEQQQSILKSQIMYSQQKQYESEKPRYYEQVSYDSPGPSRSEPTYARFYDDPVVEDYIPLSSGRKRPANTDWPRGSSPKRFSSRRGNVAKSFGARLGPKPAYQFENFVLSVPNTGHEPQPVGKSRKHARPSSTPPATISQMIPNRLKKPFGKDHEAYTLRADREPSTALNGLLELGLGFILKQLKQKYCTSHKYSRLVLREYYARRLKKVLRSRIRTIMMDKYVDNFVDVVDQYRKKFPEKTDEELMKTAMIGEVSKRPTDAELSTEAPRKGMACPNFFKKKMRKYVGDKLRKMFGDIHEMYNPPVEDTNVELTDIENTTNRTIQKGQAKEPKWKINVATLVDERLTSVIKRYIPTITTILNMDPDYNTTKAAWLATTMKMDPTIRGEVVTGEWEEPVIKMEPIVVPKLKHFYAKVLGIPGLPTRNLMRPFLDKFCPLATKTHKKITNLLFVTFNDKDNYDKFLGQDGVTVGDSTLDIKVSGKVNPVQAQNNGKDHNINTEAVSQVSIESNDLDHKINDLLSAIRKGEEQAAVIEESTESSIEKENESLNETNDDDPTKDSIECSEQNSDVIKTNYDQSNTVLNDITSNDNFQVTDMKLTDVSTEQNNVGVQNDTIRDSEEEPQELRDKLKGVIDAKTTDNLQKENETN